MYFSRSDGFRPHTVSPLDADALKALDEDWEMVVRLPDLIRGAAQSRKLAELHKRAARSALKEARSARWLGDGIMHRDHLNDAIDAARKASLCGLFARRCEKEANAIAVASGYVA